MKKLCAIDFEFNRPANPGMGIICVAIQAEGESTEVYWLWKGEEKKKFLTRVYQMRDTHIFVGYSIQQAEARCIASLGIDPSRLQWRDLMLEWRWLRNGDYRYSYGHVIQGGFPKFTVPPRARVGKKASQAEIDDAEEINSAYLAEVQVDMEDGITAGLAEAGWAMLDCAYFFGQMTFGEYGAALETKKRVRDGVIIGATDEEIEAHKQEILDYCAADVGDLIPLAHKLTEEMETVAMESHMMMLDGEISYVDFEGKVPNIQDMIGKWAARLAKYGLRGIPLHEGRLKKLIEIVPQLTEEAKWEWNTTYPETPIYRIGYPESVLDLKQQGLKKSAYVRMDVSKDQDLLESFIEEFCRQSGVRNWPRTRTGKIDTSAKVIEKYAAGENAIKQYQRHMGTMSALKTYAPDKSGNVSAMDYIGDDFVQRVDFGPFGTQTARNAAKAKSFCFLGPHWIRMLVNPPKGKVVVECLAEGTKVLTKSRGFTSIETITLEDELWDGLQWVRHGGLLNKGVKDVQCHEGIWATGNHELVGEDGLWHRHSEVVRYRVYDLPHEACSWAAIWALAGAVSVACVRKGLQALGFNGGQSK